MTRKNINKSSNVIYFISKLKHKPPVQPKMSMFLADWELSSATGAEEKTIKKQKT